MKHETFIEKISLWLDNELAPGEVQELQEHLQSCSTCQHTYQAMQQVDTLFRTAATIMVAPAPTFAGRVEAGLAGYQPASGWRLWMGLAVLLLGAAFFLSLGLIVASATLAGTMSLLDVRLLANGLFVLGQLANQIWILLGLILVFVKVSFITMQQPLFWGYLAVAVALASMWVRLMQMVYRRVPAAVELFV